MSLLGNIFHRAKPEIGEICPVGGERYTKVHGHGFGGVTILPAPKGPRPVSPIPNYTFNNLPKIMERWYMNEEVPTFNKLTEEQKKEKNKVEKQVSPESNSTFTKLTPAPDAPKPNDNIQTV